MLIDVDADFARAAVISFLPEAAIGYAASYAIWHKKITPAIKFP
jgi:hypothetical protein